MVSTVSTNTYNSDFHISWTVYPFPDRDRIHIICSRDDHCRYTTWGGRSSPRSGCMESEKSTGIYLEISSPCWDDGNTMALDATNSTYRIPPLFYVAFWRSRWKELGFRLYDFTPLGYLCARIYPRNTL